MCIRDSGKKVEHMPKASVIRSVSSPHTEIRIEDWHESLKKTEMVDFELQHTAIDSVSDEKLEVKNFSISYFAYPRNYLGTYLSFSTVCLFLIDLCRWTFWSTSQ